MSGILVTMKGETALGFVVVDFGSQADAIAHRVRGWTNEELLTWLSQFGEIEHIHLDGSNVYIFRSNAGIVTGFKLDFDGNLLILGEHTTRVVRTR